MPIWQFDAELVFSLCDGPPGTFIYAVSLSLCKFHEGDGGFQFDALGFENSFMLKDAILINI